MWILILPTLIWFSQCIDNKIWVGAFQLGGHLKQQKMDTSCFWKFTKIPKNDQFSCLPNHCKKKSIAFILYTLYNTDIGMLKLQYLFYNVSICWAMAHLKMSSRWSLWWSSAALLGVNTSNINTHFDMFLKNSGMCGCHIFLGIYICVNLEA